ncbi:hypothetical protein BKA65DRAFT_481897 [Rhexocercosporidium sp. MPI-PUGE-AT-0058]|nr:hypothetical protein BKA65DRAFT_481897 [Rhexocercosporidium sp. MPI-PUGE-AT-0058]
MCTPVMTVQLFCGRLHHVWKLVYIGPRASACGKYFQNLVTRPVQASSSEPRTELPMPSSLLEMRYPHVLPIPPALSQSEAEVDRTSSPLVVVTPESLSNQEAEISSAKTQEQGWFLYLADIVVDRRGTRMLLSLYDTTHEGWDQEHFHRMVRAAINFERQYRVAD